MEDDAPEFLSAISDMGLWLMYRPIWVVLRDWCGSNRTPDRAGDLGREIAELRGGFRTWNRRAAGDCVRVGIRVIR